MLSVKCDECQGAGFIYFGNEEDWDVMKCDCVPADEDFTEMIWGDVRDTLRDFSKKKNLKENFFNL